MLPLQMDNELAVPFLRAFSEEVALLQGFHDEVKQAGTPATHAAEAAAKIVPHLPGIAVGAGGLYAAKRLKDDIQTGEAMRRQGY